MPLELSNPALPSSPAALQELLQAPTSSTETSAETARLHPSLNHLKRPWACAKRVLMAMGDSFLCRDDAVLISHKKRGSVTGLRKLDHRKKKRGDLEASFSVLVQFSNHHPLAMLIITTCAAPRRPLDPGGCYERHIQFSAVQLQQGSERRSCDSADTSRVPCPLVPSYPAL